MNVTLRIAHVVERTRAEGPGVRLAIWAQGCSLRCPGCCNPEMLPSTGGRLVPVPAVVAQVLDSTARTGAEGISLLGGEPMDQAAGFAAVARAAQHAGLGVLVFTGYGLAALRRRRDPSIDALLASTDLLVDGPYLAARRSGERRFVGSGNQRLRFLTPRYHGHADLRADWTQSVSFLFEPGGQLTVSGAPALAVPGPDR